MQVTFILSAMAVSITTFILCIFRVKKINKTAAKTYDPRLRVTVWRSISAWLFALLCIASLISLIWLFGSYGRLHNYEGGFALRAAENWRSFKSENSGEYYYIDSNNNTIRINVVS